MKIASAKSLFSPVLFLIFFALPSTVFGHRLDEYLQATLVVIEPQHVRLQINLTPGVAVADQVLGLIDRDHDGAISTNEAAAYCDLVKRDFIAGLDGCNFPLKLTSSYFPGPEELRTGWGFIQMEFSGTLGSLAAGPHKLTIENRHLPGASVYLINAAQPSSGSIRVDKQIRNENQSAGEIEFTLHAPPNSSRTAGLGALFLIALVVLTVRSAPNLRRRAAHPLR